MIAMSTSRFTLTSMRTRPAIGLMGSPMTTPFTMDIQIGSNRTGPPAMTATMISGSTCTTVTGTKKTISGFTTYPWSLTVAEAMEVTMTSGSTTGITMLILQTLSR